MKPERASEIMAKAKAAATIGPWSDQIQRFMTPDERRELLLVWKTMPSTTSFVDVLNKIATEHRIYKLGQQVQNIECKWQGRITGFEWIDGIEMLVCHHVSGGRIELDDKRWFDPRDMRLVETKP